MAFDIDYLNRLRERELDEVLPFLRGRRVLELGGGTGVQAAALSAAGIDVVSVDVEGSVYEDARVFPVQLYDGRHLPFEDDAFDACLSSNVLEHVQELELLLAEVLRVVRPGGRSVHALPSASWRLWTSLAHFLSAHERIAVYGAGHGGPLRRARHLRWVVGSPQRHGERGNVLTEAWYFSARWWRKTFRAAGYTVERDAPMRYFYTGENVLGDGWLSFDARQRLAGTLGAACNLFVLRHPGGTT